jgi:23S rRNA (uracil1939-C5)-methyltransferase
MDVSAYRQWKRTMVVDALRRRSVDAVVRELVDAHGQGRRRVTLHVRAGSGGPVAGFMEGGTHTLIDIQGCPVLEPRLSGIFDVARSISRLIDPPPASLDLQFTATDRGVDCDVRGLDRRLAFPLAGIASIADKHHVSRVTRHGDVVYQRDRPSIRFGSAVVEIPPGSFLQATAAADRALTDLVLGHGARGRHALDLFCGVGPFALGLASRMRVTAIDQNVEAVEALGNAARRTPGLKPVAARVRDLFRDPLSPSELAPFDIVVIDPPRQGAEAQCRHLAAGGPRTVVSVSCNPLTFARDADILVEGGYDLVDVAPVDQFRWSAHVELVGLFTRRPKKK